VLCGALAMMSSVPSPFTSPSATLLPSHAFFTAPKDFADSNSPLLPLITLMLPASLVLPSASSSNGAPITTSAKSPPNRIKKYFFLF
jgi:hypothetical protein